MDTTLGDVDSGKGKGKGKPKGRNTNKEKGKPKGRKEKMRHLEITSSDMDRLDGDLYDDNPTRAKFRAWRDVLADYARRYP